LGLLFIYPRNFNKEREKMITREKLELEYLKAKVDNLEQKINIYNNQFGPNDEHVIKLKNEVKKLDMLIIDLMVRVQENSVNKAIIK
jgi:C-terminal processing protease CtpA/Prc